MFLWTNKIIRFTWITLLSLVLIAYIAIVITSEDTYYPGTIINGVDYGFKSPGYVDNELYQNPADYNLEIIFRGETKTINGKDILLKNDFRPELEAIKLSQNPFFWPSTLSQKEHNLSDCISFDEKSLERIFDKYDELNPELMVEPENPKIVVEDDVVVAQLGDQGNVIEDIDGLKLAIRDAIINRETSFNVEEKGFYKKPEYEIDHPKILSTVDYCNEIAGLKITYKYGDYDIKLTPQQLFSTIKLDEDYSHAVSKERVVGLVESLSRLYDTAESIRVFKTHSKKKINITNSHYGWQMDTEAEADNLYNDIIHHTNVERTPVFLSEGFTYNEHGDDIGDTYAEVDLTNQHMYYYKNGKLILDTDVVTGCVNLRRGTPSGIYSIQYKQCPAILRGDDYETPVTYWMPFNGGIGFHDATWRGSFGGQIYIWSGSHGCVNMPYYAAQQLYGEIEPGTPVIVYTLD